MTIWKTYRSGDFGCQIKGTDSEGLWNTNRVRDPGFRGISADLPSRQVYLDGRPLELNVKEYELLLLFLRNPGKTLRKEYIFGKVWGADSFSENQTLTVHIKMLRTKVEENPRDPKRIQTVWGVGYRYEGSITG